MKDGSKLLRILLKASEKAASIARICRESKSVFPLLIQEKSTDEKNPRFFADFKTLADVLIQQTIKHDLASEFPQLADKVKGEENNIFENTLEESITVKVGPSMDDTCQLLLKVLDNNREVAELLSNEVHSDVFMSHVPVVKNDLPTDLELDIDDIAIWIDPIDSTADYISGRTDDVSGPHIHCEGLHCVTVLIGAYKMSTNLPVLGVVNEPFHSLVDGKWRGNCYWGFDDMYLACSSIKETVTDENIILMSNSESAEFKDNFVSKGGYKVLCASGAGHKMLEVARGRAQAYVLSKSTTYKWDICAPHGILRALGGDVITYDKFCTGNQNDLVVKYDESTDHRNEGGLIVYRDPKVLNEIAKVLLPHD